MSVTLIVYQYNISTAGTTAAFCMVLFWSSDIDTFLTRHGCYSGGSTLKCLFPFSYSLKENSMK